MTHVYTAPQISRLFDHGDDWFGRHADDYVTKFNFPPALPGRERAVPRWSRVQVDRWFATGGETFIAPGPDPAEGDVTIELLARLDDAGQDDGTGGRP